MNYLILIDTWKDLNSSIEVEKKKNICNLLQLHGSKFKTYYFYNLTDIDPTIYSYINKNNGVFTDNPHDVYENLGRNDWFYFAGFHTNHCIFYNHIGIDALLSVADDHFKKRFNILGDCTAGTCSLTRKAIEPMDCLYDPETENYRKEIVKKHTINSDIIFDLCG